jgi:uncharacterized phage protein gp47/JayE
MGTLNALGYDTTTYSAKRTELEAKFKDAFGSNLRTNPETAQGQIIDYITSLVNNEDKIGLEIFNQLNYKKATGALLSAIAITKGQPRRSGTKAVITCNFTSTAANYTIPTNTYFNGASQFENASSINITTSPQSFQLVAVNNGLTGQEIGDTLTSESYLPLLTNIAITAIQDGTNNESDIDLIDRLSNSDSETSQNDVEAITDKLNNLADTTRVVVLENPTSVEVDGVPAYAIEAIVLGGLDEDVAKIIYNTKASGTPTNGDEEFTVTDSQGFPKLIKFTRPTEIEIFVKVSIEPREGSPISGDIDNLIQLTADYINGLRTGRDVSRTPIFGIWSQGIFDIDKIELSYDNVTYVETNLAIATREYATTTTSRIQVIYV